MFIKTTIFLNIFSLFQKPYQKQRLGTYFDSWNFFSTILLTVLKFCLLLQPETWRDSSAG